MKSIAPTYIKFRLWGEPKAIPSSRRMSEEEFESYLFCARRMLAYVVAPRMCLVRLFLAEVIEKIRNKGIYRHKVKKATNELIACVDKLESLHRRNIDEEFMDLMTNSVAGNAIEKVNEFRGAVGGSMLQKNIKNYIFYSYPYALMNLCYDTVASYKACMDAVKTRTGIDFTDAFIAFRGEKAYLLSRELMLQVMYAIGEKLPKLEFETSGAAAKLDSVGRAMTNLDVFKEAYKFAENEMGMIGKDISGMCLWDIDDMKAESDKKDDDTIAKLSQKFKVTKKRK